MKQERRTGRRSEPASPWTASSAPQHPRTDARRGASRQTVCLWGSSRPAHRRVGSSVQGRAAACLQRLPHLSACWLTDQSVPVLGEGHDRRRRAGTLAVLNDTCGLALRSSERGAWGTACAGKLAWRGRPPRDTRHVPQAREHTSMMATQELVVPRSMPMTSPEICWPRAAEEAMPRAACREQEVRCNACVRGSAPSKHAPAEAGQPAGLPARWRGQQTAWWISHGVLQNTGQGWRRGEDLLGV